MAGSNRRQVHLHAAAALWFDFCVALHDFAQSVDLRTIPDLLPAKTLEPFDDQNKRVLMRGRIENVY